jgi:WD40 repeat protein
MISTHSRFVRDVAFSPNGDLFASVASDGKLFFYDGKTGEVKGEADRAETSSLMACSWSSDSSKIATAGADGVVALWDARTFKSVQQYTVGSEVADQQNGVVFANPNAIVSVSLSGVLNIFDPREAKNWRKLHGPTKAITASALEGTSKEKTFYAGSFDGTIKSFHVGEGYGEEQGACAEVGGTGHSARIAALNADGKGKVWSAGWDDKVSCIMGQSFA